MPCIDLSTLQWMLMRLCRTSLHLVEVLKGAACQRTLNETGLDLDHRRSSLRRCSVVYFRLSASGDG